MRYEPKTIKQAIREAVLTHLIDVAAHIDEEYAGEDMDQFERDAARIREESRAKKRQNRCLAKP